MVNRCVQRINMIILSACFVGILLSIYTLNVERHIHKNKEYKAMCDISEHVSCTKVFKSKHAKGLGVLKEDSPFSLPNAAYGILFYSFLGLLTLTDNVCVARFQFMLSFMSVAVSIYLGYILVSVLKDFCVVCVGTYLVNMVVFLYSYKKYKELKCLDAIEECHCD